MNSLHWTCPNCNKIVNFQNELSLVFNEDGDADFDPKGGLFFHTIDCTCGVYWVVSIGGMEVDRLK